MENRYSRQILLPEIGIAGQKKLTQSKVLVIGAGGLSCPALQYLTAAGVGHIGIMDADKVEVSNLHRQILFTHEDLGVNKAVSAKNRLTALNPTINLVAYPYRLDVQNAQEIIAEYDLVVDGCDNFATRYLVNDVCVQLGKPFVFAAIHKFEGQVAVFNYNNGPTYRCLFPNPPELHVPTCSEVGVLGVLPGIIGALQAQEALKLIIGIGKPLSGRMQVYNALNNTWVTLQIPKNEAAVLTIQQTPFNPNNSEYEHICANDNGIRIVDFNKAHQWNDCVWVDVREYGEQPELSGEHLIQLPLSNLENTYSSLPSNKKIVLFCKMGIRSQQAAYILGKLGLQNCYSLKEGAAAIQHYFPLQATS